MKILSLNSGGPETMEWNGKSVVSSMHRRPVAGPLIVGKLLVEENSYANPAAHGGEHAVLYAYGLESARDFASRLGLSDYAPGSTGELITLDKLDEKEISVGDILAFGEVLAQATYPRIPCGKLILRMRHQDGQKAMQECGRSGIYFRVIKPGKIHLHDSVKVVEKAVHRISIFDLYAKMVKNEKFNDDEKRKAIANGAFPAKALAKWKDELGL